MSKREEGLPYTTDIEAISPSEAAIAVDPVHAKSIPHTNDVYEDRQFLKLLRDSLIEWRVPGLH